MTSHIIDAYNLIFQCGLHSKDLGSGNAMRQAHNRLINELSERFDERQRSKVIVVFDAKRKPDPSRMVPTQGFDVRFAHQYPDADTMIIELVQGHSQPKKLTVVSSDHQIQTAVRRRGAIAVDSDHWFDSSFEDRSNSPSVDSWESKPLMSKEEQREWISRMQADLASEAPGPESDSKEGSGGGIENPFPDGYADDLLN